MSEAEKKQQTVLVHGEPHVVPDLSHHLSHLANNRKPSPLKQLAKYLGNPDLLMLAGGLPHPSYFPFETLEAKVQLHDAYDPKNASSTTSLGWLWDLIGLGGSKKTEEIVVPKYRGPRTENQLAVSLQYGEGDSGHRFESLLTWVLR